jgi:hypothetical protein
MNVKSDVLLLLFSPLLTFVVTLARTREALVSGDRIDAAATNWTAWNVEFG